MLKGILLSKFKTLLGILSHSSDEAHASYKLAYRLEIMTIVLFTMQLKLFCPLRRCLNKPTNGQVGYVLTTVL